MNEPMQGTPSGAFEERSRELFNGSVEELDMRVLSRLTQARHAALAAATAAKGRPWMFNARLWTPAVGVTAAVLLGAALWLGAPGGHHGLGAADGQPNLEDLDMVASTDEGSADAMEMMQNDLDFYDFADTVNTSGPAA